MNRTSTSGPKLKWPSDGMVWNCFTESIWGLVQPLPLLTRWSLPVLTFRPLPLSKSCLRALWVCSVQRHTTRDRPSYLLSAAAFTAHRAILSLWPQLFWEWYFPAGWHSGVWHSRCLPSSLPVLQLFTVFERFLCEVQLKIYMHLLYETVKPVPAQESSSHWGDFCSKIEWQVVFQPGATQHGWRLWQTPLALQDGHDLWGLTLRTPCKQPGLKPLVIESTMSLDKMGAWFLPALTLINCLGFSPGLC